MAFLFDFEEIEHTTVLGLTLQDIIRDAKHRLRPWELEKKRKIRGLKKAVVPNLGYSQIYCYYRCENCLRNFVATCNLYLQGAAGALRGATHRDLVRLAAAHHSLCRVKTFVCLLRTKSIDLKHYLTIYLFMLNI